MRARCTTASSWVIPSSMSLPLRSENRKSSEPTLSYRPLSSQRSLGFDLLPPGDRRTSISQAHTTTSIVPTRPSGASPFPKLALQNKNSSYPGAENFDSAPPPCQNPQQATRRTHFSSAQQGRSRANFQNHHGMNMTPSWSSSSSEHGGERKTESCPVRAQMRHIS